ncbi:UNVERIFIED_CONTAM: hypothetical protein PYX00_002642 [Menopon gallinae]|uniref:Nucleoside diphosphate kinase-like domain-containing protein n=1 Tax=Menopon gallinae TaxID=328185 RepID=A0AAW2HY84_9NEOP
MATKTGFQLTLVMLKPHVTSVPHIVADIRRRIIRNGFYVIRSKKLSIPVADAHEFYREHREKFFFNRLVTFMTSGPCHLHVLAKTDAIRSWRDLMGPTKVYRTIYSHPESIRGTHGLTDTRNATHGSGQSGSKFSCCPVERPLHDA